MTNPKLISSICYFSIFFFPLLVPAIIFFMADDQNVKHHAKRSFISHIIPVFILIAGFIILTFFMIPQQSSFDFFQKGFTIWQFAPFLFMLLYSLVFISTMIWNIAEGVKVMR